jgi:hypothetical protein
MSNDSDPPAEQPTETESADEEETDETAPEPPDTGAVDIEEPTRDVVETGDQTEVASETGSTEPVETTDSDGTDEGEEDSWENKSVADDETGRPDTEEMSREEELDEWEQTLDERERGLQQIRAELDSREEDLDERDEQIRAKRQELQSREAELDEWEATLEERTTELDEREAAIEAQEQTLAERAEKLDEHEEILENYVDTRVGDALDGRVDRIEKVVGDRIVALEEEVADNIQTEVSTAFEEQEETTPLSLASGVALGLVGAALVAVGVIFGFAGDISSVPALHSDTLINAIASGIVVLVGLAATLTAAAGRL